MHTPITHVPPQNSILVDRHCEFWIFCSMSSSGYPIDTTLTGSGYASPNTALKPGILYASANGISLAYTVAAFLTHSHVIISMRTISAIEILLLCEKSKRRRFGATSDPFWSM